MYSFSLSILVEVCIVYTDADEFSTRRRLRYVYDSVQIRSDLCVEKRPCSE